MIKFVIFYARILRNTQLPSHNGDYEWQIKVDEQIDYIDKLEIKIKGKYCKKLSPILAI